MQLSEETIIEDLKTAGIPEYMFGGVLNYLLHGIEPGDFLSAVICNNLSRAVMYADSSNQRCLVNWVRFFYNDTPAQCWGSKQNMDLWILANREKHDAQ